MAKKTYRWILKDPANKGSIMRYCRNCGRKVVFKDSKKRRRNANGKSIYEYAIYKCEREHTWNVLLNTYKSSDGIEHYVTKDDAETCSYEFLNLSELKEEGVEEIDIILEEVSGKWRLDKLLGDRIQDLSRRKVCELISSECILLDGQTAKQDSFLRKHQKITILLGNSEKL